MNKRIKHSKYTKLKNKKLLKKYPWLISVDWCGKRLSPKVHKYLFTSADDIPRGWRKAFGDLLFAEIDEALRKAGRKIYDNFYFVQVKEKFGELRMYCTGTTKEVHDIIEKYSILSRNICMYCGKPDVPMLTNVGWISPYCEKCAAKIWDKDYESLYDTDEPTKMRDKYSYSHYENGKEEVITVDISETANKIRNRYYRKG